VKAKLNVRGKVTVGVGGEREGGGGGGEGASGHGVTSMHRPCAVKGTRR